MVMMVFGWLIEGEERVNLQMGCVDGWARPKYELSCPTSDEVDTQNWYSDCVFWYWSIGRKWWPQKPSSGILSSAQGNIQCRWHLTPYLVFSVLLISSRWVNWCQMVVNSLWSLRKHIVVPRSDDETILQFFNPKEKKYFSSLKLSTLVSRLGQKVLHNSTCDQAQAWKRNVAHLKNCFLIFVYFFLIFFLFPFT